MLGPVVASPGAASWPHAGPLPFPVPIFCSSAPCVHQPAPRGWHVPLPTWDPQPPTPGRPFPSSVLRRVVPSVCPRDDAGCRAAGGKQVWTRASSGLRAQVLVLQPASHPQPKHGCLLRVPCVSACRREKKEERQKETKSKKKRGTEKHRKEEKQSKRESKGTETEKRKRLKIKIRKEEQGGRLESPTSGAHCGCVARGPARGQQMALGSQQPYEPLCPTPTDPPSRTSTTHHAPWVPEHCEGSQHSYTPSFRIA